MQSNIKILLPHDDGDEILYVSVQIDPNTKRFQWPSPLIRAISLHHFEIDFRFNNVVHYIFLQRSSTSTTLVCYDLKLCIRYDRSHLNVVM